ncbi:MATE family efflux transporter [Cohaesibacter celericrescens]|uniref:MATE family efflux transporter n=1 Tax=Cohaesibacter celericrescens TaxID=2067669 RepID=A0A2N5XKT3_9HYPH|nr:MATE family efflux transporter [Cohaesibacter celericrescens]PLW75048.1 MATE family efflux transporter [Cohaesibacter celericrescens]
MTDQPSQPTSSPDPSSPSAAKGHDKEQGKFVSGSIFRHVVTMTGAGSVGLMAVFAVDFANLFYISLLGETQLAAAIGYSATIMFFNNSVSIGLTIAGSAIVARALGAGDKELARRRSGSALLATVLIMTLIVAAVFRFIPQLLTLVGAKGEAHLVAVDFLSIVIPSLPLLGIVMMLSGILRASGDAKGAMMVTLSGGIASAVLDPIFIFGLGMGVNGAAIASVLSRCVMVAIGIRSVVMVHKLVGRPTDLRDLLNHWKVLFPIAIPAILTNVATPVGNAYVTMSIAPYGDAAVAGWAIVGRIIPLSYTALFALSGSVGPIFGQNLGAGKLDRVRQTLRESMIFVLAYTVGVWILLFAAQDWIVQIFSAEGDTASFVRYFCTFIAPSGIFLGFLFVSNAAFNNLGHATYSTGFNWGKATLGTIPPVMLGTALAGAEGAMMGQAVGALVFGLASISTCYYVINRYHKDKTVPAVDVEDEIALTKRALSPFSSGKANM